MAANDGSVYLGEALVPVNGDISTAFPIPTGVNLGDYVLQVNGISADRQVRSVNLTLTIVKPAAAQVVMRRGCTFASGSAKPTKGCQRSLRVVSQRIPRDAIGLRIAIIGVSVDELTPPANRALARKRARAVALYLRGLAVRGTYVRTTMIAKSGPKSPLAARSVIVRNGQPRTTVTFRFTRQQLQGSYPRRCLGERAEHDTSAGSTAYAEFNRHQHANPPE